MKFKPSSFKHGYEPEDIDFVYRSPSTEWFSNGISEKGNEQIMLVGFDQEGLLAEIALELNFNEFEDGEEYFYHAMKATPKWQREYEKRRQIR